MQRVTRNQLYTRHHAGSYPQVYAGLGMKRPTALRYRRRHAI
jgi:hypothetical protein